jgi:hypothetical protein
MFTALILACSLVITPDLALCTVDNAVQFAELHRTFATETECRAQGEQFGQIALPRPIIPDEDRIKVICTKQYKALMAQWHSVLPPGRILEVTYEDTVADVEGVARRIVAHRDLPWDERCLDFHRTERAVRTASAAQVRRLIYANSIGRWRAHQSFLGLLLAELMPLL